MQDTERLHQKALEIASRYRRCESELIEVLQRLDDEKTFRFYDCTSLFQYAVKHLKLSEDTALNFIAVARKAKEVPALKAEITDGHLTVSKARKITSVLTAENQGHWLVLARSMPQKRLEREIAKVNPRAAVVEKVSYVSGDRAKVQFGVSENLLQKLKRLQDLEAQRTRKHVDLEGALAAAVEVYLDKHDPLRRAERVLKDKQPDQAKATAMVVNENQALVVARRRNIEHQAQISIENPSEVARKDLIMGQDTGPSAPTRRPPVHLGPDVKQRKPIPAALAHQLAKRDQRRCTAVKADGSRCENTRWLDYHHVTPVCAGGTDTLQNLATVCRTHHLLLHQKGPIT